MAPRVSIQHHTPRARRAAAICLKPFASKRSPARIRGGIYLAVLGLALMLAALAITVLLGARNRSKSAALNDDVLAARRDALSAIELGRFVLLNESTWRTARSVGPWFNRQSFSGGALSLAASSPSGSFTTSAIEPVTFTGTGEHGSARQKIQATFIPIPVAFTCLNVALCAGTGISFNALSSLEQSSVTISANGSVSALLASVAANVQAVGSVTGATFKGTTTRLAAPLEIPSNSQVRSYANGATEINITSLPKPLLSPYQLTRVLLSPANNPYGQANSAGVYVIDCQNRQLQITDCRIVGTLILKDPGAGTTISGSVRIAPIATNLPCLIVEGDISINLSAAAVKESNSVNFNPDGTPYPYPLGTTDSDKGDSYPSAIAGLIYVHGNATISGTTSLTQLVATGSISISGTLLITNESTAAANPPAGFVKYNYQPAKDGWVRVVDP